MNKLQKIALFTLVLIGSCMHMSANIYFRNLGKSNGLSQLSVMSICQDELGRMWFGTLEGLNCYDGIKITSYKYSDEYPMLGNQIHNLVCDKEGNLFFTSDQTLIHLDMYQEKFTQLRSESVSALYTKENRTWMAVNDSIFEWDEKEKQFSYFLSDTKVKQIKSLCLDHSYRFWIGTLNGVYRFDTITSESTPRCIIPHVTVQSLYVDSHNNMFAPLLRNGMYKIYPDDSTLYLTNKEHALSSNDVRSVVEDNTGNLWIATFNGLNKLDPQGNFSYYKQDNLPGSLKHSSVFPLYKDMQGTIWLGTYFGGTQYFNPQTDLFTHYTDNLDRQDCLSFFIVGKMAEDKRGDIWICTEGGGLNKLNRQSRQFTHYLADGKPNSIPFNNLKCIAYDKKRDRLYIGTHTKGLFSMDLKTQQVVHYADLTQTGSVILHLKIHNDLLYFSSLKGLMTMDLETNKISQPLYPQLITSQANVFQIDSNGRLWISQFDRLHRINLNNSLEVHTYWHNDKELGKSPISAIVEDREGSIFLGTRGSGLYKYDPIHNHFIPQGAQEGWGASKYCYEMAISKQGRIIISGEQGITFFNPKEKSSTLINQENSLHLSGLSEEGGILVCENGEVFVGGTDGMSSFMENKLSTTLPDYKLYFSSLSINGQSVQPNSSQILTNAFPFSSSIKLKHDENNLTITFTSNNYIHNLEQKRYEYKLKGFDNRWITTTDNKIIYTNLNPGNYTLEVREKDQGDTQHAIGLQIKIQAPWYATWWAYISYLFIISAISYSIVRSRESKHALKRSLEHEKREKEKSEEIAQAKLQFFSNISHEFRTPLTLITSQIEMLQQHKGLTPFLYTRLQRIHRNATQLKELITELLDFRKLERGGFTLNISKVNLVEFLRNIHQEFREQASLQEIDYCMTTSEKEFMYRCDTKHLKKVIFNLLSNAFKHTPKQGKIELILEVQEHTIQIKVMDTGKGISEKEHSRIFERFYQAKNSSLQESGTGIGLALSKGLVELHHGSIHVHSAIGYGSIFTVELPKRISFTKDEQVNWVDQVEEVSMNHTLSTAEQAVLVSSVDIDEQQDDLEDEHDIHKQSVLIVEDNEELLLMLTELLSPLYKVRIALNGQEGLAQIIEEQPDLILSDIMMPIMTGTELCMKVKNNFDLCHIPFILLTALTSDENNIEGLQCGADDYIGKPFNNKLLISKIASMLRTRNLLKKKYSNLQSTEENTTSPQELALNAMDRRFLIRLNQVIEDKLSDPDFDVTKMAQELGISRSSLYNKLKGLSSMTPNEFVMNIKLNRAVELLRNNPELQITEIAYKLGFNSLRYFRYCFKAQFNQTPQEYRNNNILAD